MNAHRTAQTLALGGYPAKQCPRLTHNEHSPTSPPRPEPTAEQLELFAAGNAFEADMTDLLATELGDRVRVLVETSDWQDNVLDTLTAMHEQVPVIVGGRLPEINGRVGAPDVLVGYAGGYVPVDIKNHRTIRERAGASVLVSRLADPTHLVEVAGYSPSRSREAADALQLAHYTRMLIDLGFHTSCTNPQSPAMVGGIIGTSDHTAAVGERFAITWHNLEGPGEVTYSATAPDHRLERTWLERYDHEFTFRTKVARVAATGGELVRPIGTWECQTCPWVQHCTEVAGPADASFAIQTGRLDAREWLFLYSRGGDTVTGLAALNADAIEAEYASHSVGRRDPAKRLREAIERARMIVNGIAVEPRGADGWPEVPAADVEIDFDIEWDRAGRIYQWGLRTRTDQDETTARYKPVLSFDELDDAAEAKLADEFADQLEAILCAADAAGQSVRIFHWHHVEVTRTKKFDRVARLLEGRCTDLLAWFNKNLRAQGSSSLKAIAPLFGAGWDVDDAGGYASLTKIEAARRPDGEAARAWCLRYNECDVAAQAAIRDGLSAPARLNRPSQATV